MIRFPKPLRTHAIKLVAATLAGTAGVAAAVLVGVAVASSFTLQVAKNASVTNQSGMTTIENIAATSRGFAIYTLSGDSKSHPKCTKHLNCLHFWPPVTVSSPKKLSKAAGIKGKLGVWHRNGFFQVTLAGHPLYRYSGDTRKHHAIGQGIRSFGGTWRVVKAAGSAGGGGTTTTTITTTTTTTTPCLYPPCY